MIIYRAKNISNGKVYIGQTIRPMQDRTRQHRYEAKMKKYNMKFHHAINKYGFENFIFEIIAHVDGKHNADFLERSFIEKYNSTDDAHGYNMSFGGEGNIGLKHTDEAKKRVGIKNKGKLPWNKGISAGKGVKRSNETRKKISDSRKGNKNPMYGKSGVLNPFYRSDISNDIIFQLAKQNVPKCKIAKILNCSTKTIRVRMKRMEVVHAER